MRGRKKQATEGQYGDIAATDPIGHPLIARITFELKRGYKLSSPYDALDSKTTATMQFTAFIQQASLAAANAGTPAWALITQRDRRDEIITCPTQFFSAMSTNCRRAGIDTTYDMQSLYEGTHGPVSIFAGRVAGLRWRVTSMSMRLADFLKLITPEMARTLD